MGSLMDKYMNNRERIILSTPVIRAARYNDNIKCKSVSIIKPNIILGDSNAKPFICPDKRNR